MSAGLPTPFPASIYKAMKYLSQFLIILGFSLLGEALAALIPLGIPASVYGIVLLFATLCLGLVKLKWVKDVAGFLVSILPVLFVPPMVGLLENRSQLFASAPALLLLIAGTTVLTMGISGRLAQALTKKEESHEAA